MKYKICTEHQSIMSIIERERERMSGRCHSLTNLLLPCLQSKADEFPESNPTPSVCTCSLVYRPQSLPAVSVFTCIVHTLTEAGRCRQWNICVAECTTARCMLRVSHPAPDWRKKKKKEKAKEKKRKKPHQSPHTAWRRNTHRLFVRSPVTLGPLKGHT